ncbi:hypothetical protein CPT_Stills105 [Bacillus phage Stills]|uniref:Uncharacterized protein n=1 Tax=Bacillus phage Stills TaxID=1610833 RepID=A0A0E3X9P1_9CAUD|nr:hypothetical protein CPT_Stills105 [Bacillus phage Stills]AKC02733.1 hypothetical protein CPT_Stills105 [Bacillus phage Stills]
MWNTSKLSEKEFNAIMQLEKTIQLFNELDLDSNIENFFLEKDVTLNLFQDVSVDINHDELFLAIKRFMNGETKVTAIESAQYTGFQVVEILNHHYDYVFGFTEQDGEKTFWLCETHDNWSEACEEGVYFAINDMDTIIALHDCIRTDI